MSMSEQEERWMLDTEGGIMVQEHHNEAAWDQWSAQVDTCLWELGGVASKRDLPDKEWREMYEDNFTPRAAAIEALNEEGWRIPVEEES